MANYSNSTYVIAGRVNSTKGRVWGILEANMNNNGYTGLVQAQTPDGRPTLAMQNFTAINDKDGNPLYQPLPMYEQLGFDASMLYAINVALQLHAKKLSEAIKSGQELQESYVNIHGPARSMIKARMCLGFAHGKRKELITGAMRDNFEDKAELKGLESVMQQLTNSIKTLEQFQVKVLMNTHEDFYFDEVTVPAGTDISQLNGKIATFGNDGKAVVGGIQISIGHKLRRRQTRNLYTRLNPSPTAEEDSLILAAQKDASKSAMVAAGQTMLSILNRSMPRENPSAGNILVQAYNEKQKVA